MQEQKVQEEIQEDFSFKSFFVPLTTMKAVHWIIIVGLIVFANMLFNGFVWEDNTLIINNPWGHTFDIFNTKVTFNDLGQFRPVTALYSAILFTFFNTQPFFYHIIQLVIHCANAIIIFFIFKHFFSKKNALLLSLLFLIIPINSESVVYIGAFDNPLFILFGCAALYLSLKEKISLNRFLVISTLLILSLLSKETGVLFFVIITFYKFLKRHSYLPFLILTITIFCLYLLKFHMGGGLGILYMVPIKTLTLSQRLENIPLIILYYIKTFFVPIQLVVNQQWVVSKIDFQNFYFPLVVDSLFFLSLIMVGWYLWKQSKNTFVLFLFFFLWFISGLLFHHHFQFFA